MQEGKNPILDKNESTFYSEEDTGQTYTEEKTDFSLPIIANRVLDPNVARELADIQAKQGMDSMFAREQVLIAEKDSTELTTQEQENAELIDGLSNAYPNAFKERVLNSGHKVLIFEIPDYDIEPQPNDSEKIKLQLQDDNLFFKAIRPSHLNNVSMLSTVGFIQIREIDMIGNISKPNVNKLAESDLDTLISKVRESTDIKDSKNLSNISLQDLAGKVTSYTATIMTNMPEFTKDSSVTFKRLFQILEREGKIKRETAKKSVSAEDALNSLT